MPVPVVQGPSELAEHPMGSLGRVGSLKSLHESLSRQQLCLGPDVHRVLVARIVADSHQDPTYHFDADPYPQH